MSRKKNARDLLKERIKGTRVRPHDFLIDDAIDNKNETGSDIEISNVSDNDTKNDKEKEIGNITTIKKKRDKESKNTSANASVHDTDNEKKTYIDKQNIDENDVDLNINPADSNITTSDTGMISKTDFDSNIDLVIKEIKKQHSERSKKKSFYDLHVQQNVWIRKSIANRINKICKGKPKGEKTRIFNDALRLYLEVIGESVEDEEKK